MYESLANVVMIIHVSLMVGILVGMGLSITTKRFRPVQLGVILVVILIWLVCGGCPLTFFENSLRLHTSHPIPLAQVGFIPYYTHYWFGFTVPDQLVKNLLYLSAGILSALTLWETYRSHFRR